MRLHILSDIHLEFAPFELPDVGADALVLAGDMGVGHMGIRLALEQARADLPVLYVPGNHEYFRAPFHAARDHLRSACEGTPIRFLDRDEAVVGGVRFLGCTLWTDYAATGADQQEQRMEDAMVLLNDHSLIRAPEGGPFSPAHALVEHRLSLAWLTEKLATPFAGATVVITHHAPIRAGFPRWAQKNPTLVAASVTPLQHLMGADRAALWVFGHTHWPTDVRVRGTRVVSNPRGYPRRPVPGFDPRLVVEVASVPSAIPG